VDQAGIPTVLPQGGGGRGEGDFAGIFSTGRHHNRHRG
jgi:hypothetical protein